MRRPSGVVAARQVLDVAGYLSSGGFKNLALLARPGLLAVHASAPFFGSGSEGKS